MGILEKIYSGSDVFKFLKRGLASAYQRPYASVGSNVLSILDTVDGLKPLPGFLL